VRAALNQRVSPAGMAVPLKFALIVERVDGTSRASRGSHRGWNRLV
jgi:hypothetical protein